MVKIAIQGISGRMGAALLRLIAPRDDCEVTAGVDVTECPGLPCPVYRSADELLSSGAVPDVLIDFSQPDATATALAACARHAVPMVVCTTGLPGETLETLRFSAEKTAIFHSANMSVGINLLARLIKQAAAALPGFDIEIVEKHHRGKVDAPSGTALALFDALNERGGYTPVYDRHGVRLARGANEVGISAVRGGSIVGEHEVLFAGPDEVLTLSHGAYSRDVFASGAIAAALFVAGKGPGLYTMNGLLEAT